MAEDRPAIGWSRGTSPEHHAARSEASGERGLAILALLARQFSLAADLEEAIRISLESAIDLDRAEVGAFVQLDPETREVTRAVEMGLPADYVTRHVLPELVQRFEEAPLSARHPYFRTGSHSAAAGQPDAYAVPFRTTVIPLIWDEELRGLLVTVGSADRHEDAMGLEALQSFVSSAVALHEKVDRAAEAEKEWGEAIDRVDEIVFITDGEGRIRRANRRAEAAGGEIGQRLEGLSCADSLHRALFPHAPCFLRQVCGTRSSVSTDVKGSGDTWHRLTIYPVVGAGGQVLGAVHWISDVTELKRRPESEEDSKSLRRRENELTAVEARVQALVHDLKNPLTHIAMTASRLEATQPERSEPRMVLEQVERMRAILEGIMSHTREMKHKDVMLLDLNEILLEELSLLESDPFFDSRIRKEIDLAPDLPKLVGERADFSVSFANILTNALHALWGCETQRLGVATRLDEDGIVVEVRDTGVGISSEDLPKIFEPFFTSKPLPGLAPGGNPTGTGLGLASVQQHLGYYGARFSVESEPGRGTCFTVRFPLG